MNSVIDYTILKQERREMQESGLIGFGDRGGKSPFYCTNTNTCQISNASLPWEILETAKYLFQKKGFENTTRRDICEILSINNSQFHTHFDSLDEILEILWSR